MNRFLDRYFSRYICGGVALREARNISHINIEICRKYPEFDRAAFLLSQDIDSFCSSTEIFSKTEEFTIQTFKNAHANLMRCPKPGEFRNAESWVGLEKTSAKHIAPSPALIESEMRDFCAAINDRENSFLDIALLHREFMRIHPFVDGNGRIGRAFFEGLITKIHKNNISPFIYRIAKNKNYEYEMYLKIRHSSSFFEKAEQWSDKKKPILQIALDEFRDSVYKSLKSSASIDTIDYICINPVILIDSGLPPQSKQFKELDLIEELFQKGIYSASALDGNVKFLFCQNYFVLRNKVDVILFS